MVKCHNDYGGLVVKNATICKDRITNGVCVCNKCGTEFHISEGILELINPLESLDSVSSQEVIARDKEAQIYDTDFDSGVYEWAEINSSFAHLDVPLYKNIIEFGCGTGRFTIKLLNKLNKIIALDFSRQSLLILAKKLDHDSNIGLVLADVTQSRFASEKFDLAISTQVLEHIPTKSKRAMFFERVSACLAPNGTFFCTAYHQDLKRIVKRLPQEGFHKSNIFYHYFTVSELKEELISYFDILHIHPIEIQIPFARRLHLYRPLILWLSRMLEHATFFNKFGNLVLIKARNLKI